MMNPSELDDIDKNIIVLLQQNPAITHSDIAKQLNRSQPAIGARIKKLTDKGILATQIGVDFQKIPDLNLMKIELATQKPEEILEMANCCPFIINVLKLSGEYNIAVFMASGNLKKIDAVIDNHFRNKEYVSKIRVDLVTGIAKKFIMPVDFNMDKLSPESEKGCALASCKFCKHTHDTKESATLQKS